MKTVGYIHSFETLGALDGPGMRCVVFFQGCPLRCAYCHNPDTWHFNAGQKMTGPQVVRRILKSAPYFENGGGVTLSGGEPLAQAKFAGEILQACKEDGIHTAVDTCGFFLNDDVKLALEHTDLVILDIKHADAQKYAELTGKALQPTLDFLSYVTQKKIPFWIRQVIVGGLNDTNEDMDELAGLLKGFDLSNLEKIELLGYHEMAKDKWRQMGIEYAIKGDAALSREKLGDLQDYLTRLMRQAGWRGRDK